MAEVPVQAHAHGDAFLPHVDEEHRPEHLGLELRAVHPREREEYRELEEADGVEGRPRHLDEVQARIFHEPGRGERLRLRRLDRSGGDAHGGCVSAPDRAATVAESRVGQVSFQGVNRHWAGFCSDCGAEKRRWIFLSLEKTEKAALVVRFFVKGFRAATGSQGSLREPAVFDFSYSYRTRARGGAAFRVSGFVPRSIIHS